MTWKFILAFQAVMWSMFSKGVFIAVLVTLLVNSDKPYETMILIFGTLILPNLVYSFISIASSTGMNKKFFQIIIRYPASWVLPVATFFAVGPSKYACCSKSHQQNGYLGFSRCSSIANLILTIITYVMWLAMFGYDLKALPLYYAMYFTPVLLTGVVFTIIFLSLSMPCCCSASQTCCFSSCCGPQCFVNEVHVIHTNANKIEIIQLNDI